MTEKEILYKKYEDSVLHERALKSMIEELQYDHKRSISEIDRTKDEYHEYSFNHLDEEQQVKALVRHYTDTSNFLRKKQNEFLKEFNCVFAGFMSNETNEIRPVYIYSRLCGQELKRSLDILYFLHPYDLFPSFCNETQRGAILHVMTSKCEYKVSMNEDGSYWVIKDFTAQLKTTSIDEVCNFFDSEIWGDTA